MIIRKPYAFLIKNFRKVHIVLLVLSLFVMYKLLRLSGFVNNFMNLGTYDFYNEPVSKYITVFLYLSIFLLIVGSLALLILLKRKDKPWRIYLVPVIEYIFLLLILGMISSFFNGYTNEVATTDIRLSRDLLVMLLVSNFVSVGIFLMRSIGMDINKFSFSTDQEFLEMSEEDREEVELRFKFDKYIFVRKFNKLVRNSKYFYFEHKLVCNISLGVVGALLLFGMFRFAFITNRSYREGQTYKADGYTIKVNKSYFTDKDGKGEVISKDSNFVIVNLTITNEYKKRLLKLENFHLKSGVSDFVSERKTYEKEFSDLGSTYDSTKELKTGETVNFIIIFKVDKKIKQKAFILCYQENNGFLRKIKLNINDISKITKEKELILGEDFEINYRNKKEKVSLDKYEFLKSASYMTRRCTDEDCYNEKEEYTAPEGKIILKIDFASENFEGKEMVDFSRDYGKIIYIDNSKMEQSVEIKYPFPKKALGKYIYALVPEEVAKAEKLGIIYVVRNEKYTYRLK